MAQFTIGQGGEPNSFLIKFLIGILAGFCAAFVPRLVAFLALESGHDDKLRYLFPNSYILVGVAFTLVIGAVTAVLDHRKSRHIGETFLMALGIPALLSGALNSSTASKGAEEARTTAVALQRENHTLVQQLAGKENIPILEPRLFKPVTTPESSSSLFFSDAYASQTTTKSGESATVDPTDEASTVRKQAPKSIWGEAIWGEAKWHEETPKWGVLGVYGGVRPTGYILVLDRADSQFEAGKKLEKYKGFSKKTLIYKTSDKDFFIVDGNPLSASTALEAAVRAKKEYGGQPSLFPILIKDRVATEEKAKK